MLTQFALRTFLFFGAVALFLAASSTIHVEQNTFGWWLFVPLLALFFTARKHGLFARLLLLAIGAFLSLRYLLFRSVYTLHMDSTLAFSLGMLLFMAELYSIVSHLMGLFVNAHPKQRNTPPLPQRLPSIDVFIPTYNEDISVALITAIACKGFNYPKELVNIYILNDGSRLDRLNRPELRTQLLERHRSLQQLAHEAGVRYLTREDGAEAKAGMIKAAFNGKAFADIAQDAEGFYRGLEPHATKGELLLILDCDHIPTRDMPNQVVGYFTDPGVFLVQTPHFMINADPLCKNIREEGRIPCESWMFYQAVHKGLDQWDASFFCGSAAFLRRTALEEVGGLCGDTITEDAETALALHAKGYRSVYVDKPMIAGLAPESIADMLAQRIRWCQGMLQILLLKNPLGKKGLSAAQRLCYLNSCLFWTFPLPRLIFLLAPLTFLLFDINVYNASIEQVLDFAGPHLLASILLSAYMFPRLRPFPHSDILETLQVFTLLPAIASVLVAPRKPVFITTPKGITLDRDRPDKKALPLFLLLAGVLTAFVSGLHTWLTNPFLHYALNITLFWNLCNLTIILCAIGAMLERKQVRQAHRFAVADAAFVDSLPGKLMNLSGHGFAMRVEDSAGYLPGQQCVLQSGPYTGPVQLVRTNPHEVCGRFLDCRSPALIDFIYGDSGRWQHQMDSTLKAAGRGLWPSWHLVSSSLRSAGGYVYLALRQLVPVLLFCGLALGGVAEAAPAPRSPRPIQQLPIETRVESLERLVQAEGGTPKAIHLVMPELDEAHILRALYTVQHLSRAIRGNALLLSVSALPQEQHRNIFIGQAEAMPAAGKGRSPLLLTEADIAAITPPPSSAPPLSLLPRDSTLSFSALGADTMKLSPQAPSQQLAFRIASNTYRSPNRKLDISLEFAYSAGLDPNSRLDMMLNGALLAQIHLDEAKGVAEENHTLHIPLSLLRQGLNTLEMNAVLQPADTHRADEPATLTVFNASTLHLPDSETLVRLPDLAVFMLDAYPFTGENAMHLDTVSYESVGALLNVAALISQKNGAAHNRFSLGVGPWAPPQNHICRVFTDPELPEELFKVQGHLLPGTRGTVGLFFSASNAQALLEGSRRLWLPQMQQQAIGTAMTLNLKSGEITAYQEESVLMGDTWLFPELAWYADNFPLTVRLAACLAILCFTFSAWLLLRQEDTPCRKSSAR